MILQPVCKINQNIMTVLFIILIFPPNHTLTYFIIFNLFFPQLFTRQEYFFVNFNLFCFGNQYYVILFYVHSLILLSSIFDYIIIGLVQISILVFFDLLFILNHLFNLLNISFTFNSLTTVFVIVFMFVFPSY